MGCGQSQISPLIYPVAGSEKDLRWLYPKYHDRNQQTILRPHELESFLHDPPSTIDTKLLNSIRGSIFGLALGDALGAHVEFRPHQYMIEHPVKELEEGGTWGLKKGQFTDDTSMALCLAISLITKGDFNPYDQLVLYKYWYKKGYMSSTGQCFDIGSATRQSLNEFEYRQRHFAKKKDIPLEALDFQTDMEILHNFDVYCGKIDAAGNGGLMRLAPVPLFFHQDPKKAVEYSGLSTKTTHGDPKASDACRFYGALIVAAVQGISKAHLLDSDFYKIHKDWFGDKPLHEDVRKIAEGSYKHKDGYKAGIRGKGFVLNSLEAALWAFWSDEDSFEKGVLAAINLGDDTDTTAAIYGQLAGACYGYKELPIRWVRHVYAKKFITCLCKWIAYLSIVWFEREQ
ncbi:unnamed protein product [Rotaria magnacalcarata]|uniref:ADP-ribosylglycohydrolase n=2 Tax=Rotaria magnacalcarata TaxID=392030 RepID=A0A815AUA5_9BILA|nr:unnamed protein product [Rotaria magnacalcarata]CAF1633609.1 unnamed protein product [Rotaria magnacalcarata]CAF1998274.1 unnamed protein product [Rotaria magnacalcarata]CAF2071733.1 unnamed protein product [Rotaria magnacalcarata]CAF2086012.1 unnamed protein product [Rotaria magnacalcarata]